MTQQATEKRAIPEGYEITADGFVYSTGYNWRGYGSRLMVFTEDTDQYLCVRLTVNGVRKKYRIHRLVAATYLPPRPSPLHEIRHLNGNKRDNRAVNLAWGTRKENADDREKHKRERCQRGN